MTLRNLFQDIGKAASGAWESDVEKAATNEQVPLMSKPHDVTPPSGYSFVDIFAGDEEVRNFLPVVVEPNDKKTS